MRRYVQACTPPPEIQRFACRQAGKRGKFEHLTDLPEAFVGFLINFVLDAIGLGDEGLLLPVANHKEYRTKFWMELAGNDADRETMFNTLSDARTDWSALARVAIGRALADVRAFTYKNTDQPLVPSHVSFFYLTTLLSISPPEYYLFLEAKNRHAGHMRVSRAYATAGLAKILTFPYVGYDPLHRLFCYL
ncbi:hypothetical protein Y032_0082g1587 [Ancylostoma ceylanicum]|uniref:Uncharacterized protein n=1 Tax=Ancylostoma ceylanicum TaxID=53326 RepID=A0A016TQY1_9BILA|nr:hypothetical protein Y032_0082g1587 [Ancylostoma ceylanicum]